MRWIRSDGSMIILTSLFPFLRRKWLFASSWICIWCELIVQAVKGDGWIRAMLRFRISVNQSKLCFISPIMSSGSAKLQINIKLSENI